MIGIFKDEIKDFLESHFGKDNVKITNKNIIFPCPWCEWGEEKDHYHLYLSLELPIFNCFHAECSAKGNISKLFRMISGRDISKQFILEEFSITDKYKFKEYRKELTNLVLPEVDSMRFRLKSLYIKGRISPEININKIPNLVFDIRSFLSTNKIQHEYDERFLEYLQQNFVGFLTSKQSCLVLRNIDSTSKFRYHKISFKAVDYNMLDYFKLNGNNNTSNVIVLAEGIFDILSESYFDFTGLKQQTNFYACCLSDAYESLIKSIGFDSSLYRIKVKILSDRGILLERYEKLYKKLRHLVDSIDVYYNQNGKDFNVLPVSPVSFIVGGS